MNNFEFYNPVKIVFGEGVLNGIGAEAKQHGKKAMIVSYTDVSFFGDLFTNIAASLKQSGVDSVEYFAATANPTIAQAQGGIEICKKNDIDMVIGVGGGSAMDCAKVIAAGVMYDHDLTKMISFSHSDDSQIPPTQALPIIMVPTLPATGSEMNPTAVITDEKTHSKSYVWAPECLFAKSAFVDPSLAKTLPAYQTACGALDTISHTLESYFNGEPGLNLDLQDRLQEGLVKTVIDNLPKVLENGLDIQTRGVMQWASALALNGWVLTGTYTWAPMHQFGHILSTRYEATHGAALSVIMIAFLKFFSKHADNARYVQFADRLFGTSLEKATVTFEKLVSDSGIQTRISEFGGKADDIDMLVDDIVRISFNADGVLGSVPALSKDEVKEIFTIAMA